jgi:hypothetical protein
MIVVTDGRAKDIDENTVKIVGQKLREAGDLTVVAVGVNKAVESELLEIASSPDFVHNTKKFADLEKFLSPVFAEICKETGGKTMIEGRTIDTDEEEFEFDVPCLTNGTCMMQTDIVIALDAFSGVSKVNHAWQKIFTKSLVANFDSSTVRISVNPMSRDHAALEYAFTEPETQDKICKRIETLNSGSLKYRGYHFYEGFYPEAAERWFKDSVGRNKAIVIVKHLTDNEPETVIDKTQIYWEGSPDEPVVFVVAIGTSNYMTKSIEKLFKLAGHPDRVFFMQEWEFTDAQYIATNIG